MTAGYLCEILFENELPADSYLHTLPVVQYLRAQDVEGALDKESKPAARVSAIRGFRNLQYHDTVPQMLALVADENEPLEVRVAAVEALGWFNLSCRKSEILEGLQGVSASDEALAKEITQTINRLE